MSKQDIQDEYTLANFVSQKSLDNIENYGQQMYVLDLQESLVDFRKQAFKMNDVELYSWLKQVMKDIRTDLVYRNSRSSKAQAFLIAIVDEIEDRGMVAY